MSHFISAELPLRKVTAELELASKKMVGSQRRQTASIELPLRAVQRLARHPGADATQQVKFVMGGYSGNIKPGDAVLYPNHLKFFVNNASDYKKRYHNTHPANYDAQMQYFKSYLSYLSDQGVHVLVVGMPLTELNREILPADFWQEFRGQIAPYLRLGGSRMA